MAQRNPGAARTAAWRDIAVAGGIAVAAIALLALVVTLVWAISPATSNQPAIGAEAPPTPTPRAIALSRTTAIPELTATSVPDPIVATESAPMEIVSTATVSPLVLTGASTGEQEPQEPLFDAPERTPFSAFASAEWTATEDRLANSGTTAIAEPWLTLATVPSPAFAIEAEIRVTGLLESVCDQSFGVVAGGAAAGQFYGAGVFFPCADGPNKARLTDVSVWEDGFNADPVLAEEAFEPEEDWRVYRFELRGEQLRLVVDDTEVLNASQPGSFGSESAAAEAGIWTQGVGIEVRRIAVYPLPA